jgi:hypothetical protein
MLRREWDSNPRLLAKGPIHSPYVPARKKQSAHPERSDGMRFNPIKRNGVRGTERQVKKGKAPGVRDSWSTVWLTCSNQPVYEIQNESGTETAPGRAGLIGHPTFPNTLWPWQSLGKNVRIRRFMNAPLPVAGRSH